MKVTVEIVVAASVSRVWEAWTSPEDIMSWNFAIDEWCCPAAKVDLKAGGKFNYRMEAKDGSMGFDYRGEFTKISPFNEIQFKLDDGRSVTVEFNELEDGVRVIETFEVEDQNSAEQQRQGWQGILGNFKKHIERNSFQRTQLT
ncbi:MAG: SRPBCC family protein [Pseudomonadota bacterium]